MRVVLHEAAEPRRVFRVPPSCARIPRGNQEHLQRGEALLPIDNEPALNRASWIGNLFKDDGTHEVRMDTAHAQVLIQKRLYVFPEIGPVALLVPDVGTLEQRHAIEHIRGEQRIKLPR